MDCEDVGVGKGCGSHRVAARGLPSLSQDSQGPDRYLEAGDTHPRPAPRENIDLGSATGPGFGRCLVRSRGRGSGGLAL